MNQPAPYQVITPSAVMPNDAPLVPAEDRRVVGYTKHAGGLMPVYQAPPAPIEVRTVVVHRGVDPRAQILAAGGALAAGTGWGAGQVFNAISGMGTGSLVLLVVAILAWRCGPALRPGETHNHVTTNNNGWLSHSHTTTHGSGR